MTVQPIETDTHIDLATLVGDMPAIPCDSRDHGGVLHDAGPATHYGRTHCPKCPPVIRAYCQTFAAHISADTIDIVCHQCSYRATAAKMITILGPVNA